MTGAVITKIRKIMGVILMVIGIVVASKGLIPESTMNKIQTRVEKVLEE